MIVSPGWAVRGTLFVGLAALGFAASGCSSLRYKKTDDLWVESDQKFKAGQYADAKPYYDELLRRDENDGKARLLRGISEDKSGDTSSALDDYQKCAEQGDARALLFRAGLNVKAGFFDAAERDLGALKGMSLDSHEQVAQLALVGTLRLKQGNARMAIQSLERACDLARGQSDSYTLGHARDAHYNAAQAYYQMGEFQSAMDHMEQYRQIAEQTGTGCDGRDYYQLCILHYLSGDMEGARGYLSKADPDMRKKAGEVFNDPAFFGG
jgi:tetratricopeptide (TPR) repeat protein